MPLFALAAGVNRFSICFSDTNPGSVNWGVPAFKHPLTTAGGGHWSVKFNGVKVGDSSAPLDLCSDTVSCLGIPDSGTTLLMGPKDQVAELLSGICGAWPRCQKAAAADTATGKDEHFKALLLSCQDWMSS